MNDWILPVFPQGSLSHSVVTTVWVGVLVTSFFNLRFGWVLSGLVIPGYLVPLLLVKPWAAAVILLEGIVTYVVFRLLSEKLFPRLNLTNFFGRDRFFGILLLSVFTRLVFDMWLLPNAGKVLIDELGINFDYRANLHSFGLIIVALIANQFWKPGLKSGLATLCVNLLVTFFLVRYVLMVWTNFSMSGLNYMYEDLASSMLASPKAYIILLTTAFIASRMNLFYGWEFNGILIPSLLALQWYQPGKILTSFVEAFVVLFLSITLLRLPPLRKMTMEGARKVLLFFNVSFAYKIVLGFAIAYFFPAEKVSDYYGFGYLLPSLLAVKMYDKDKIALITRSTLQTSLVAVVVASLVGLGLSRLPYGESAVEESETKTLSALPVESAESETELLNRHRINLYKFGAGETYVVPLPSEIADFREGLHYLEDYRRHFREADLEMARLHLGRANFRVSSYRGRSLLLAEKPPERGWGLYMMDLQSSGGMLVQVPAPLEEWGASEAGYELFNYLGAGSLAISGAGRDANADGSSDVLTALPSFMQVFQGICAEGGVLQIRGYTASGTRQLEKAGLLADSADLGQTPTCLFVRHSLPEGFDTVKLSELVGKFDILWRSFPEKNVLRDSNPGAFAELVLDRADRRALFFKPSFADRDFPEEVKSQSIEGYLQDWILGGKVAIARKGSNAYRPPELEELLYFDQEILTPLFHAMRNYYVDGNWTKEGVEELFSISRLAGALDYRLIRYRDQTSGVDYLILSERREALDPRYWGTYVFRLGQARNYLVEIPRPLYGINVFEFGVSLFASLDARALLISGTHPDANDDGGADLIRLDNRQSLFTLAGQAYLRESGNEEDTVLFCRAFGSRDDLETTDADLILAPGSSEPGTPVLKRQREGLIDLLERMGLSFQYADGSPGVVGYEVGDLPQALYCEQTGKSDFVLLWMSDRVRRGFRQQSENYLEQSLFDALGIPTREVDVFSSLERLTRPESEEEPPSELRGQLRQFVLCRDSVLLESILRKRPDLHCDRLVDINSKQAFLLIRTGGGAPIGMLNLSPLTFDAEYRFACGSTRRDEFNAYMDARAAWLFFTPCKQPEGGGK